ncbi:hypothetical protein [Deinococcus aerophilus]|uniref:YokE-like PH domain-containing protein n=1 Tax=Deinococcus aerophilus TaxID=522488 RepID=A0ABQ2GTV4_9DEIO|nr:hypothetical protein [Deinococcus aerophilus]GGM13072.1 hypothetical protein GCM10010841_22090 [Deinococcus aerophilus]
MTERAPSERAQSALKASGIHAQALTSLERDDALFVLTGDMLVYQDDGGTRRVTLRDLTRIHSDQEGLLRVETPAGTALTASLLGFDVAQVQDFFKGVRDATARAKDLSPSPTPTVGGAKTFGSAPAAPPEPATSSQADPSTPPAPAPAVQDGRSPDQPVVISSSSFSPGPVRKPAAEAARPTPGKVVALGKGTPAMPKGAPDGVPSSRAEPQGSPSAAVTPPAPEATEAEAEAQPDHAEGTALSAVASETALARQTAVVEGFSGRLRVLGAVLFVAAVLLAFFQFTGGEPLAALWTALAGGVGTIALLALAEIGRLLSLMARAPQD